MCEYRVWVGVDIINELLHESGEGEGEKCKQRMSIDKGKIYERRNINKGEIKKRRIINKKGIYTKEEYEQSRKKNKGGI